MYIDDISREMQKSVKAVPLLEVSLLKQMYN